MTAAQRVDMSKPAARFEPSSCSTPNASTHGDGQSLLTPAAISRSRSSTASPAASSAARVARAPMVDGWSPSSGTGLLWRPMVARAASLSP
jgi:hypothetical protein